MLDTIVVSDWIDLLRSLDDESIDALITDMPYDLTRCEWETEINLEVFWDIVGRKMRPSGPVILTAKEPFTAQLIVSNLTMFRVKWIWHKIRPTGFLNISHQPLQVTEDVLVFAKETPFYNPQIWWHGTPKQKRDEGSNTTVYGRADNRKPYESNGERYPVNLIQISISNLERGKHPTQKPIALMKYFIQTYSKPGDLIVDPFCGSGPTAIAARLLDRHYICGDISPEYVEIANQRLKTEGRTIKEMPLFAALDDK